MIRRFVGSDTALIALTAFALLAPAASAQDAPTAADVAGLWERVKTTDSASKLYAFTANGDALEGEMLTPPQGMTCSVALALEDGTWKGAATFEEPDYDPIVTAWEFSYADGKLTGRSEWVSWDDDGNESRGWEDHTFVRVASVGLVTEGSAEEAPFGDPVDPLSALAGGWKGPGGAWELKVDGTSVSLKPIGHMDEVLISLTDERGILRGHATLPGGGSCDVELALDEGRLNGRSSWIQGADLPEGLADRAVKGWSPIGFERLERLEVGPADANADAPAAGGDALSGVWKRDDGHYLRARVEAGEVVGVLCDADGNAQARLRFVHEAGVWVGTANWGDFETRWELSVGEGGLTGRAEWVDVHDGQVIARGWSGRTFTALQKVQ
jgi:hypothetical protein